VGADADGLIDARHRTGAVLAPFCLLVVAGVALAIWLTKGGTTAFDGWAGIGLPALILIAGVVAFRSWSDGRRFGSSRLVPHGPDVHAGETFIATLEASPWLVQAREVRFDLVEMHRSGSSASWGEHVRATAVVSVASYQVIPGFTRVPVSLKVPADGWASFKRSGIGFSLANEFLIGTTETEHAWEVRAVAVVEGRPYRAKFRVRVASLEQPAVEAPYTPRPIGIPASDKRSSREVK
jgi:hypothetical protein